MRSSERWIGVRTNNYGWATNPNWGVTVNQLENIFFQFCRPLSFFVILEYEIGLSTPVTRYVNPISIFSAAASLIPSLFARLKVWKFIVSSICAKFDDIIIATWTNHRTSVQVAIQKSGVIHGSRLIGISRLGHLLFLFVQHANGQACWKSGISKNQRRQIKHRFWSYLLAIVPVLIREVIPPSAFVIVRTIEQKKEQREIKRSIINFDSIVIGPLMLLLTPATSAFSSDIL